MDFLSAFSSLRCCPSGLPPPISFFFFFFFFSLSAQNKQWLLTQILGPSKFTLYFRQSQNQRDELSALSIFDNQGVPNTLKFLKIRNSQTLSPKEIANSLWRSLLLLVNLSSSLLINQRQRYEWAI